MTVTVVFVLLQKKLPQSALSQCLLETAAQLGANTCSGLVRASICITVFAYYCKN